MLRLEEPLQALEGKLAQVRESLGKRDGDARRIWVKGPTGSGRTTFAIRLAEELGEEKAALVLLPPADDIDASIHTLYLAASYLKDERARAAVEDRAGASLYERAKRVAEGLHEEGRVLVLVVPASWRIEEAEDDAGARARTARARELFQGLLGESALDTVIFSSSAFSLPDSRSPYEQHALPPLRVSPETLHGPSDSPLYADAVRRLRTTLERYALQITPLQIRIAVGLVALGDSISDIADELKTLGHKHPVSSLGPLEGRLVRILKYPKWSFIRVGLRRLARSRYPLPREQALALANLPEEHAPLVVDCVGFGDGPVRMNEYIRRALHSAFPSEAGDRDAHDTLAEYHDAQDGATDVSGLSAEKTLHWLEKVHHLAHGNEHSRQRWLEQNLRARDFYWDHAWCLSFKERRYEEAAAVYRMALDRFGEDSYTCHYLAYNLDRAGKKRREVERLYRRAIEQDPINPWWNSRLVTFLIGQARFRAAREEWFEALDRIDPDRERVHRSSWIASHVHRWVVREWLDHGQVELAREAFDEIPSGIVQMDPRLLDLKQRLEDAEETRSLGESVYPASIPVERRWRRPRVVPELNDHGSPRVAWYPGRVVEASEHGVTIVVATPHEAPSKRRVVLREMTREEWLESAWCPPELATGFIEVGRFEDEGIRILPIDNEQPVYAVSKQDEDRLLRYLKQW